MHQILDDAMARQDVLHLFQVLQQFILVLMAEFFGVGHGAYSGKRRILRA
jgi:hypothetical protein